MRLMLTKMCKPGDKLAKTIYNDDGMVLLNVNAELTSPVIRRLEHMGIDFVYIQDKRTDDLEIPEMITEQTKIAALKQIRASFRQAMDYAGRGKTYYSGQVGQQFRKLMEMIMNDISSQENAMLMMLEMNANDLYLYQHSLNVCIYATMLGVWNGYSKEELMTLGLGALLHDIGKTQIKREVLQKPGKLTDSEFEEMKRHSEIGYRMLKDEPNFPLIAAHCAFQHHERINGSGYPRGIQGSEIHDYAQWIGLVDSYDAMTTHRVYRSAMLPHQAMEILYTGSGTLYDRKKIELFRDKIALYPLGVMVRLNTGASGIVVDIPAMFPHRPTVRVLYDEYGQELTAPHEIELSRHLSTMIVAVNEPLREMSLR